MQQTRTITHYISYTTKNTTNQNAELWSSLTMDTDTKQILHCEKEGGKIEGVKRSGNLLWDCVSYKRQ